MESVISLQGDPAFTHKLLDKSSTFFLIGASTETANIPGITVAGLPGFLGYTPALDFETLYYGMPKSMPDIALSPEGPPSPVLITSVIQEHFSMPKFFIDAGAEISPKAPHIKIDSAPSGSILEGAHVDAKRLFEEGQKLAEQFKHLNGPLYLAECVPGGTTTAYAVAKALGYACDSCFASSTNAQETRSVKQESVENAWALHKEKIASTWDAITYLGDPMQPLLCGMLSVLSQNQPVVLAGGTQMATVCAILKALDISVNFDNIALMTTQWIINDPHSDLPGLLQQIDPSLNAFYAGFNFSQSRYPNLRLYDEGLVKEGVGAGAMLCHALLHGISSSQITESVDSLLEKVISA